MRITHIDNAKAIGMMLIVASHVWGTAMFHQSAFFGIWDAVLNSFYVPLFVILSGVFEPTEVNCKKLGQRLRKLGSYIVIFVVFGFVSMGIVRGQWQLSACLKGTTVWFLITLLWVTLIFHLVRMVKSKGAKALIMRFLRGSIIWFSAFIPGVI